ncbi:MAG: FUSC family protein [Clostridium sp.]|nr:FUSC family protein [Clostridium sp.]
MKSKKELIGTIIGNTVTFIGVLIFVALFKMAFGAENTVLGIATIILSLSLLSRDLTKKPFKNFVCLLAFNIITILGSYVFHSYLWLGLVLNFLIMFLIGYLFTYEVKSSFNMLFGLQYILLIGSPISLEQMPKRIFVGIICAGIIMGLQLLANKNKLAKSSKKTLISIEDSILAKVNLIKENKSTQEINSVIDKLINNFKITIFESGQTDFKMNSYGSVSADILSCIEKINELLNKIEGKNLKEEIFNEIYMQLSNVKENKFHPENIKGILKRYEDDSTIVCEFLNTFHILQNKVEEFKEVVENTSDDLVRDIHICEDFKEINWHKKNIKEMSYRVAYGIRVGVLFGLTGFVTQLFHLEFGKWMMFTVFALTQPYAEYSEVKSKHRIFGTTLGLIILLAGFAVVKDTSTRSMFLLVAGYLMSYINSYKYKSILITICATCADAVNHINPLYVMVSRAEFVLIGVIISLLANKFLLRREYKDAESQLVNIQKGSHNKMIEEVINIESTDDNMMRNLFLLPALIETRVENLNLNVKKEFMDMSKGVVNDIYQLYLTSETQYKGLIDELSLIVSNKVNLNDIEVNLRKLAEGKKDPREKALILNYLRILYDIDRVNEEADKINNLSFA